MPTSKIEITINTVFNRGTATITGVNFDPGSLAASLPGLDFGLMNASFAGFSDLRIRQRSHLAGMTYRVSGNVLLNASIGYLDYQDDQPYLFDASGHRVLTYAGLSWVF